MITEHTLQCVSFDFNLFKILISRSIKQTLQHKPACVSLCLTEFDSIWSCIQLENISEYICSIVQIGWLSWNTKEKYFERQQAKR